MKRKNSKKILGSQTDVANEIGCTQQRVSQLVKDRIIKPRKDRKIHIPQAKEAYLAHVNISQQRDLNKTPTDPKKKETIAEQTERYHKARADREVAEAELAQLELKKKKGELINAEDTKKTIIDVCRTTRDRLLAIPRRVAPMVVGVDDERKAANLLYQEIELALQSLCDDGFKESEGGV